MLDRQIPESLSRRRTPSRRVRYLICWTWALLSHNSCAPTPRVIAVATDTDVLLYDTDLNAIGGFSLASDSGQRIHDLEISSDGASSYLAVSDDEHESTVLRVQLATGHVLARRQLPASHLATDLQLIQKDRRLLLASAGGQDGDLEGVLTIFDTGSLTVAARLPVCAGRPTDMVVLEDIDRLYVRCANADALVEVDLELARVVQNVPIQAPGCGTGDVARARTGSRLYATCDSTGVLYYIDRRRLTVIDSASIGTGIRVVAIGGRGRVAFVPRPSVPELVVVDTRSRSVVSRVELPGAIKGMLLRSTDSWLFAVAASRPEPSGQLFKLAVADSNPIAGPLITGEPVALDIWPSGQTPILTWLK